MNFLVIIFMEAVIIALISGALSGSLGVILYRMNLLTISFTTAHAALAGAALSLIIGTNPELTAFIFSLLVALLVEALYEKIGINREMISMALFSFSSALSMFAIFMTPTVTLTSEVASLVLWGSVLAVTPAKILLMLLVFIGFILYISAFKFEIDSILFDYKLAEAEGVNVSMHAIILILVTSISISLILKLTGAFLTFSLLFNPSMSAIKLSHKRQAFIGGVLGGISGSLGVVLSFILDSPIGATIALTSSIILLFATVSAEIYEYHVRKRIIQ